MPVHFKQKHFLELFQGTFDVTWSGWQDDLAGIMQYEVEVFKLIAYGEKIGYRTQTPVSLDTVDADTRQHTVNLADPGE